MLLLSSRGAYKGPPLIQNHRMTILFACPARPRPPRPGGGAQRRAGFSSGQLLRSSCGPGRLRRGTLASRHSQQEVHRDHCSAFASLFHRDVGTSLQTLAPLRPQPPPHQLVWGAGEGPGSSGFSKALRAGFPGGGADGDWRALHECGAPLPSSRGTALPHAGLFDDPASSPAAPPHQLVWDGEEPGPRCGFSGALRAGLRRESAPRASPAARTRGFTMVLPALRLRPRLCECRAFALAGRP